MNNLLLIDNRVNDISVVISSLTNNTSYLVVDYENETLVSLQSKISNLQISSFENVGIFQENYEENTFSFVDSFGESILTDVENLDNNLSTWQQFKDLIQHLKNNYGMVYLDLMGCNINSNINWNYVNNKLSSDYSIIIRSSNDNTGTESLDGNWILESKNTDLVNLYFTENIKSYNFILGAWAVNGAVITKNGKVLICGQNANGQMGIGTSGNQISTPTFMKDTNGVNDLSNAIAINFGIAHTLVLMKDGRVLACGQNNSGQLGIGQSFVAQSQSLPVYVKDPTGTSDLSNIVAISACNETSLFLTKDGNVLGCGNNNGGTLGDNSTTARSLPVYMLDTSGTSILTGAVAISTGYSTLATAKGFSIILMNDGRVVGCGNNNANRITSSNTSVNYLKPQYVDIVSGTDVSGVIAISTGIDFTLMLMNDGRLLCRGNNTTGILGQGNTTIVADARYVKDSSGLNDLSGIVSIQCGQSSCLALNNQGKVLSWGSNQYGQLGFSTNLGSFTLPNYVKDNGGIDDITNVVSISSLRWSSFVLLSNGQLYGFGRNQVGQLGIGDITNYSYPTQTLFTDIAILTNNVNESFIYKSKNPNSLTNFVSLGYPLSESILAGYTLTQLIGLSYSSQDLLVAGYAQEDIDNIILSNVVVSNICFLRDTPINTDQGIIPIQNIDPTKNTIRNKKIVAITKTISPDSYLICFEKDSICKNVPCMKTVISKNHLVFNNGGSFIKAKEFVGKYDNVHKIKYNGEILYNVLLEDYDKMLVNNLICETLHPENYVAQIYKYVQNITQKERQQYIKKTNRKIVDKKIFSNKK